MEHELSRSTKLIRSLLDFSVQSEPKIKEVNINEVLNRALELAIHAGSKENTRVEKDLHPLPTFMVDPDQLEQVFVNLIMNALQAMPRRNADPSYVYGEPGTENRRAGHGLRNSPRKS